MDARGILSSSPSSSDDGGDDLPLSAIFFLELLAFGDAEDMGAAGADVSFSSSSSRGILCP
eukprot:CAMPEP_0178527070 /NCGR_PEP_ID=MMETSP0696-20121128/31066_1 /TAXON_ID=265572 /ORGANISM="Extubocellulus spinifer, Strain CCMP396" /LENGTH=60 /DNA_ID=CAMNT_0020158619 /DNA_START=281 /DNA_END=463 /DNA_ORIENTATION=-